MSPTQWVPSAQRLIDKRLWILGYTAEDYPGDMRSVESLKQHPSQLDINADFAFRLLPDATFVGRTSVNALRESNTRRISTLVLFHNFNGTIFDPQPLRAILSSPTLQRQSIQNILESLPGGVAGVHIDFEAVEAAYRVPYINFLEALRTALQARGLLLTIAVPAKRSEWEAPGYDFAGIGRVCDAVTIMTYDEHFSGGHAGPIASLPWMTQALDYATGLIPRNKILVGIPVYGYDWSNQPTKMIPMRDIQTVAEKTGAKILWSDEAVEPYFYYWLGREKHTVWFENELSTKIRFGFVKSYRLRGIAIWRLGYETNKFWQGVASKFKR